MNCQKKVGLQLQKTRNSRHSCLPNVSFEMYLIFLNWINSLVNNHVIYDELFLMNPLHPLCLPTFTFGQSMITKSDPPSGHFRRAVWLFENNELMIFHIFFVPLDLCCGSICERCKFLCLFEADEKRGQTTTRRVSVLSLDLHSHFKIPFWPETNKSASIVQIVLTHISGCKILRQDLFSPSVRLWGRPNLI